MPFINNERPEQAANVLADDHSEIDTFIEDLLSALDEGDKSKAFAHLDLLWARLAVHIRAEHLCLFPSILEANFSDTCSNLTFQEAQRAIDKLRLDHDFFVRELEISVNAIRNQDDASDHEVVNKQFSTFKRIRLSKSTGRIEESGEARRRQYKHETERGYVGKVASISK